jgi:exodeoxyribonuclease VII small subunit
VSPPKREQAKREQAKRERPEGGDVGYAEAMAELETILDELESDQLDVDVLAERVRRASELLTRCRDRISRAQSDVDKIVADLDDFEVDAVDDLPDPGSGDDESF